jgi:hypothetical protein
MSTPRLYKIGTGSGTGYTSATRPNGVSFATIETQINLRFEVLYDDGTSPSNYGLTITPQVGFAAGEYGVKTYTVGFTYFAEGTLGPLLTGGNTDTLTFSYFYVDVNEEDTSPPTITPKYGTEIVFSRGVYTTLKDFVAYYFIVDEPQGGGYLLTTSPPINFSNTLARTSITLSATNKDGYTRNQSFFLTINLAPSQTPPSITGPSSITVFTDENLNNTTFLETKGYTITGYGTVQVTFSPSVNWTTAGTYNTTITAYTGANDLTTTKAITVTVAQRVIDPVVGDSSPPVVTRLRNLFQFLRTQFPSGVTQAQVQTAIIQSFSVSDQSSFTIQILPAPTAFTLLSDELRGYQLRAVDSFGNTSQYQNVLIEYVDNTDQIAPTITGPNSVTFVEGENKTEIDLITNYTLSDNTDLNPQWFQLTPTVFNVIGTYNYLLRATDSSNNIQTRTVVVNVVPQGTDTIAPVIFGPSSLTFREADEKTVADLIPYLTVTDNISPRSELDYEATVGGSSVLTSYVFPVGNTEVSIRFYDEAENYSAPFVIRVEVLDDDIVFNINEDLDKLSDLTANHLYSGPIVSIIKDDNWTPISWLVDPVTVNYTIDGLSDEININFISKILDTRLLAGDLVRVTFDSKSSQRDTWGLPTYDLFNRPVNHDVMLIDNGSMVKNGNQDIYRHNYKLVELINILKDYRIPTLTFTSFTTRSITDAATGNLASYYAEPYNAYTILQRAIKLAKPNTTKETNDLPSLIGINGIDFLFTEMVGVDHQFEEATLYDVVTEIGRIIGRTPVLYLNPNYGTTNSVKYMLFFETEREHSKATVSKVNILDKSTEYIETTVQNRDAQEVVVDAHNLIGSKVTTWPSDDMYGYAVSINEEELDTKDKPLKIVLPYKISSAEIVRFKKTDLTQFDSDNSVTGDVEDGTMPIYKYNEWLVLDSDERQNSAYYKEGENEVFFGSGVDDGTNDWEDYFTSASYRETVVAGTSVNYQFILFQVEYFPLIDLQARVGDGKQITFNQVNPLVDSETLGDQVANYLKSNQGGDITVSKIEYHYEDILKPTQLVEWDNEIYVVTSVSFNSSKTKNNIPKSMYKVAYQLNKQVRRNFNLNAPTNQREYQLSYENAFDRFDVIKESVNLHFTTNTKADDAPMINTFKYLLELGTSTKYRYLLGALNTTTASPTVESAAFSASSIVYTSDDKTTFELQIKRLMAHSVKTIFGASVLLNLKMFNNIFAGTRIFNLGNASAAQNFSQRQVPYTDPFGKIQRTEINFVNLDFADFEDILVQTKQYPQIEDGTKYAEITSNTKTFARIINYEIDKDTRENYNVTLQVDYKGVNGTSVGSDLVKYSGLYQSGTTDEETLKIVKLKDSRYNADDRINPSDIIASVIDVVQVAPLYDHGYQIILDDDYEFDTTSTYALAEVAGVIDGDTTYKVLAIMGSRTSLVETDTLFIYY